MSIGPLFDAGFAEGQKASAAEIERLRDALEFVRTDPCFKLLGTVTHDTVTDALGLTNILNQQKASADV